MDDIPVLEIGGSQNPPHYDAVVSENKAAEADPALSINALSPEEKKAVTDFMGKINLYDTNVVMQYGAAAQNKVAQFSDSVLRNVKTRDLGEVGKDLAALVSEIKGYNGDLDKKGGFFGLFKNVGNEIEKAMAGYSKVETNVDKIVRALEEHQRTLMKDMSMLDTMYKNNVGYFKELSLYIIAGQEKLDEFRQKDIPAQRETAEKSGNEMDSQKLNDMVAQANRFEKKLHDLKLSRIISMQMAPQIRLVQNNDIELMEKIQSSLVNAIPLWKNQMVISLGLANSKAALTAQQKVTDMTNELLVKNSELLKQGSIEVAKESEKSLVSIETLRKTNENLLETINAVLNIQQEGSRKRAEAEGELVKMEGDLKRALLESGNRA